MSIRWLNSAANLVLDKGIWWKHLCCRLKPITPIKCMKCSVVVMVTMNWGLGWVYRAIIESENWRLRYTQVQPFNWWCKWNGGVNRVLDDKYLVAKFNDYRFKVIGLTVFLGTMSLVWGASSLESLDGDLRSYMNFLKLDARSHCIHITSWGCNSTEVQIYNLDLYRVYKWEFTLFALIHR